VGVVTSGNRCYQTYRRVLDDQRHPPPTGDGLPVPPSLHHQHHAALTAAVSGLAWSKQDAFYLAKEFIVVKQSALNQHKP
jgi:hypothetical protein